MMAWEIALPVLVLCWVFGYGFGKAHLVIKKFKSLF